LRIATFQSDAARRSRISTEGDANRSDIAEGGEESLTILLSIRVGPLAGCKWDIKREDLAIERAEVVDVGCCPPTSIRISRIGVLLVEEDAERCRGLRGRIEGLILR
jgi:hypothetical protein